MNDARRRRLEAAGWKTGSYKDFLGLSDEEAAFIEVKYLLSTRLKERRRQLRLTQQGLAKRLGSSQSRVAKMEAGEASVSLDLLLLALFALGETPRSVGRIIARAA
jgi:DNA-binding XRE family transcriptional regulator